MRILHEFEDWNDCMFVTLTYSDDYLPLKESLKKEDLQKFFKRLRKNTGKKIKYFACGEYGEENGRPHYHCIIFGMDFLSGEDRESIKDAWRKCDWSKLGLQPFGDVSATSIRYVVSYLEKSIKGSWQEYAYDGIEIPFHLVSKGLGLNYAKKNQESIKSTGYISIQGYRKSIPRYYASRLDISPEVRRRYSEEKEKDTVMEITGFGMSRDEMYLLCEPETIVGVEGRIKQSNIQNDLNLKARDEIRSRRKKRDT